MDAFIFGAVRTPRGKREADGALPGRPVVDLAAMVVRELAQRNCIDASLIDDIIFACASPAGTLPGSHCASGLDACNLAAAKVMAGGATMAIGGGTAALASLGPWLRDASGKMATFLLPQALAADLLAANAGYSRSDLDAYSVASHQRAQRAAQAGWFRPSLVPVCDPGGQPWLECDELIRPQSSLKMLGAQVPWFASCDDRSGTNGQIAAHYPLIRQVTPVHHAGNSGVIVDGAAAVLFATRAAGEQAGMRRRARVRAIARTDPPASALLPGTCEAAELALKRAGMRAADIDLAEVNEAFAAEVLFFMDQMDLPHDRVNVNGGAIAMGHPLGAAGAMILGVLLDELERRDLNTGLATLRLGAGPGIATIIERA